MFNKKQAFIVGWKNSKKKTQKTEANRELTNTKKTLKLGNAGGDTQGTMNRRSDGEQRRTHT